MIKKMSLIIPFLLILGATASAHPHLFIKSRVEPMIDGEMLQGVTITWTWDKWWSMDVLTYCDLDGNNLLDDEEIEMVYRDFFSGVKEFGWFMQIRVNGERISIDKPEGFNAVVGTEGIVTYSFFIPLNVSSAAGKRVSVIFNDETIYTSFDLKVELIDRDTLKDVIIKEFSYYGVEVRFTLL
jgi:ABC-type uncharacterized transport system substrate-binding protein